MELKKQGERIVKTIQGYFPKEHYVTSRNIALSAYAIMRSEKVNTAEIARHMSEVNGHDFKANDMRIYRLLKSNRFQVRDKLWRGYFNYMFHLLRESGVKKGQEIAINVDFTTDRDDFVILCASIVFQGESIPLYFSMRKYPKRANMMNQKKMEDAFFKALRHLLPDYYQYIIVCDRGFGNSRIINILDNNGFEYVIRLNDNLAIEYHSKKTYTYCLPHHNFKLKNIQLINWKRSLTLVKKVDKESYWLLAVSNNISRPAFHYAQRFSIERMFKYNKSGGFHLEHVLVHKYDRFKRLLFISCIAYASLMFTGFFIKNKVHFIKKNSSLHLNILSQFSD